MLYDFRRKEVMLYGEDTQGHEEEGHKEEGREEDRKEEDGQEEEEGQALGLERFVSRRRIRVGGAHPEHRLSRIGGWPFPPTNEWKALQATAAPSAPFSCASPPGPTALTNVDDIAYDDSASSRRSITGSTGAGSARSLVKK